MKKYILVGIVGAFFGAAAVLLLGKLYFAQQARILPTDGIERFMNAAQIKEKYGVEVGQISSADSYQLQDKSLYITVATQRIPYYIYNGLGGGRSVAMLDLNSPSPKGFFFVYNHQEFEKRYGCFIPGVKFSGLTQYSAANNVQNASPIPSG